MSGEIEKLQELVDQYDNIVFFGIKTATETG